ncbi:nuclear transport factor 2 family protein [Ekhidna sp.]|uniref:nuclear transport factor 2 family protein n=1 Tax=Ekhidna sp. TaxID=2608089 RepID=UPI003C797291
MKKILIVIFCAVSTFSFAQSDEKSEIMKVVNRVFEAMRTNDSTMLKQSFTENPNTFTAFINKEGKSQLVTDNFQRFIDAIGQPKDQVWNEPIWNEKVEIDGNLASVWVDYAFYVDDQFSHCGVDAFHLIKREGGWKIFHLVDTRRRLNCEVPDEFKP